VYDANVRAEGQAMSLEQAMAYALEDASEATEQPATAATSA
jgi:hypothetical protein